MQPGSFRILLTIFIYLLLFTANLMAQPWQFIKERDSIKVYTRSEENSSVKSYKGETDLHCSMETISSLIGSVESFKWWADNIHEIKVLAYEKEKYIRYYFVYDVPWPISDRDLCVEAKITTDPKTGVRTVLATPLEGVVPEKPNLVRIKNYWQEWVMEPKGKNLVHLILEGSVDPGGYIPPWIVNMVISDTPLNIMRKVREQVQ